MTRSTAVVRSVGLACLTMALVALGPVQPVAAQSVAGQAVAGQANLADYPAVIAAQNRLLPSANRILLAVRGWAGYSGIAVAPETGRIALYWNGKQPARLANLIGAEPVPVDVIPARYSLSQLVAEAKKVIQLPGVSTAGPLNDGSGLSVSVRGEVQGVQAISIQQATPVPVQLDGNVAPVRLNRQNDSPPYFGGAIIVNGNGICTSGFALKQAGVVKMLTAGHCGENGDVITDGGGQVMGAVEQKNPGRDTLLIDASSAGYTFSGAYTSNTYKPVRYAIGSIVDTLVCASGANTGQHCPIRIKALNQYVTVCDQNGQNCVVMGPLVRAEHDSQQVAAGAGDSGGPIVATDSCTAFGCTFVYNYPMGTITAGDGNTAVPCGPTAFPTQCSWRIFYADVTLTAEHYDAEVVKGGRYIGK